MHPPAPLGGTEAPARPSVPPAPFWTPENVIHVVTRADLVAAGDLVDLSERAPDVCRQHVGELNVCCTASVWATVEAALRNRKYANDVNGIVHDLLWMARRALLAIARGHPTTGLFQVYILGAGRQRKFCFRITVTLGDRGEPVVTILEPHED